MNKELIIPYKSQEITLSQFKEMSKNFDVALTRRQTHLSGKVIAWGQKYFLKSMNYPKSYIEEARKWVHAWMVYRNKHGSCIESNPPKIREFNVEEYMDKEFLLLRHKNGITLEEESLARFSFQKYNGMKYDFGEYMVYPFYMAFGTSPGFWRNMWDTEKPVCSGFVIKMYNEMGKLLHLKNDIIMFPPACLIFLNEFEIIGRYVIVEDINEISINPLKVILKKMIRSLN